MQRLLKRWVACSLSLMIMLHSTFLSVSATSVDLTDLDSYIVTDNGSTTVLYFDSDGNLVHFVNCDSESVNPIDDSSGDVPDGGEVLSDGVIADAIATGAGIYYCSDSGKSALGSMMMNRLREAAADRPLGTVQLESWLSWAQTGTIKLESAPSWIYETIVGTMYDVYSGEELPVASSSSLGPVSGMTVPAGEKIYIGVPSFNNSTGQFDEPNYYIFDCDVVPCFFVNEGETVLEMSLAITSPTGRLSGSTYQYFVSGEFKSSGGYCPGQGTFNVNGVVHDYRSMGLVSVSKNAANSDYFYSYCVPGAFSHKCYNYNIYLPYEPYFIALFDGTYSSLTDYNAVVPGGEVTPDLVIGGIAKLWSHGVNFNSVRMPDIILGEKTSAEVSALTGQVNSGEITWSEYWLQVSGKTPSIDTGDGIYNITDDGLGDTFLGESEDSTQKGIFATLKDFFNRFVGGEDDRNAAIDDGLPGATEDMETIDQIESDVGDQMDDAFTEIDISGFALSASVLSAIAWITGWVVDFFNSSGEAQVVLLLPLYIGLALLFIGRGSLAMTRVDWHSNTKEK